MANYMHDIRELMCDELEQLAAKREISVDELDAMYKLVDIIRDIDTIELMQREPAEASSKYVRYN